MLNSKNTINFSVCSVQSPRYKIIIMQAAYCSFSMLYFLNLAGSFCTHVTKNVSNMCSSKTYYINKNKNDTISSTDQLIISLPVVN
jgi:hypothetical protein